MGHHILLDVTRKKHKVLFVLSLFWSKDFDQQPFFCYNKSRWPLWSKHVGCYFPLGCMNCPGKFLNFWWTNWTGICIVWIKKMFYHKRRRQRRRERLYQKIWCFCCISDNLQIPEIRLEIRCTLGLIAIAHYFLILFPLVHKWWHLINRKSFLSQNWLHCTSTEQKMFRFVPHAHHNRQQKHHCGLYFMGFPTSVLPALRTVRL